MKAPESTCSRAGRPGRYLVRWQNGTGRSIISLRRREWGVVMLAAGYRLEATDEALTGDRVAAPVRRRYDLEKARSRARTLLERAASKRYSPAAMPWWLAEDPEPFFARKGVGETIPEDER